MVTPFKSLLDKLNPKIKATIELDRTNYPTLVECLFTRLNELYIVVDMTYGDALTLMNYYKDAFGRSPIDPWECFEN
jgi:hypothetical protein